MILKPCPLVKTQAFDQALAVQFVPGRGEMPDHVAPVFKRIAARNRVVGKLRRAMDSRMHIACTVCKTGPHRAGGPVCAGIVQRTQQTGKVIGGKAVIAVEKGDEAALGLLQTNVARPGQPAIVLCDQPKPGIFAHRVFCDRTAPVSGAVVDDKRLKIGECLGAQAGDGGCHVVAHIVNRHDDRDCGHGRGRGIWVTRHGTLLPLCDSGVKTLVAIKNGWHVLSGTYLLAYSAARAVTAERMAAMRPGTTVLARSPNTGIAGPERSLIGE